jgi:hypothetical protein
MPDRTEDEWEKLREMVRNAPPGTAQTQWRPDELAEEPPRRTYSKKALITLVVLALAAGAAYVALEHGDQLFGKNEASSGNASSQVTAGKSGDAAPADAPAPQTRAATTTLTIKKGLKTINVRANPSPNSPTVARLRGGDRAESVSESGDWVQLRFQSGGKSMEGWVRRDLLEE